MLCHWLMLNMLTSHQFSQLLLGITIARLPAVTSTLFSRLLELGSLIAYWFITPKNGVLCAS